ncbi:MAG TPA: PDDEXK nuclease domain-containing protein [Chitinophagaceae bacterium]|jgi:predicted nuclease of restriction endonuclease-like (RecB) superfamily
MPLELSKNYTSVLQDLKEKIRQARLRATVAVNNELLKVYWEIGDIISKQEQSEGWGTKTVENLAKDLKVEFRDMKGLSSRNLRYMRDFALAYPQFTILQQSVAKSEIDENQPNIILQRSVAKLPWGHNCTLLDKLSLPDERAFYAQKAVQNGWSRDMLANQIEGGLFKRQGAITSNFGVTLPVYQSELAIQLFKDPYHLDFVMLGEEARERDLEDALTTHITKLLLELGDGFAFMGRQKRFEVGNKDFFVDLLFYHTRLRRYVIIDLKIGEFEPEFVSKMNLYLGLADDILKGQYDEPSIGLILCKTKNRVVAEYALRDINKPIGIAEYKIGAILPEDIKGELPSIEEIEQKLDKELQQEQNPIDARLKAIREKLKGVESDEIKTPATFPVLLSLFENGLKLVYQELIEKLTVFDKEFHDKMFTWSSNNKSIVNLEQLEGFWKNEEELRKVHAITFTYALNGFKKAGTENYGEHLQLNFEIQNYWYGFTLVNHNNQQPFIKKLYHQPITKEDRNEIIAVLMNKVMDKIDWIIEMMGEKNNPKKSEQK